MTPQSTESATLAGEEEEGLFMRLPTDHEKKAKAHAGYLFAWQTPVLDGKLKAMRALELASVFDNVDKAKRWIGTGRDLQPLADKVSSAWDLVSIGLPHHGRLLVVSYSERGKQIRLVSKQFRMSEVPSTISKVWERTVESSKNDLGPRSAGADSRGCAADPSDATGAPCVDRVEGQVPRSAHSLPRRIGLRRCSTGRSESAKRADSRPERGSGVALLPRLFC